MSATYGTDTREAPCGTRYRVDWTYDYDHDAPEEESDGHGVVVELVEDPADYMDQFDEDDEPDMEEVIRHKMMRRLSGYRHTHRHGQVKYYDVWETMKRAAAEGWGVDNPVGLSPEEIIDAAIEADFDYLHGWYNDDWHWCGITVTLLAEDEDGNDEDTEWDISLWGANSEDDAHHEEMITELLADVLGRRAEATTVITATA
jgi:hypothetical protein